MKLADFEIGGHFFAKGGNEWLCTDKGTRTITAIELEPEKDAVWFVGPPYAVDEVVFDEDDMEKCYVLIKDMIIDRATNSKSSAHPGFSLDDITQMFENADEGQDYHRTNLLKKDRVSLTGDILHPYTGVLKENGWHIKTFELFSKTYSEMHENDFVKLKVCDEGALSARARHFHKHRN